MNHSAIANAPLPQPTVDSDAIDIDLLSLFHVFWRRKFLIILFAAAGFCASFFVVNAIPPTYVSRSLVLLNASQQPVAANFMAGVSGLGRFDSSFVLGEIEIIRSRMMVQKLAKRLRLFDDPLPEAENESESAFKSLVVGGEIYERPQTDAEKEFDRKVSSVLRALSVRAVPGSSALQIEFSAKDPVLAAKMANTIVDLYIEQGMEDKLKARRRLDVWYEKRLGELRQDVRDAEQKIQTFRFNNSVLQGRKGLLSSDQISGINAKLINARADVAGIQAKLEQIKMLDPETLDIEALPEIINSRVILGLRADYLRVQTTLSDLSTRYGPKHPRILQAQSERERLKRNLRQELLSIESDVRNELSLAQANVQALEQETYNLSSQTVEDSQSLIELDALERDANALRAVYEKLLASYKTNFANQDMGEPSVRIISRAVPPYSPASPNKKLILSLGTFLFLCMGLLVAIILGRLDQTVRSALQLETLLGVPCYGVIPTIHNVHGVELSRYVVKHPGSMVAEAVRTLRTVIGLRARDRSNKVISLTSSFSGEGKTMMSTWIGRATAKAGEKVIVIDCDLRRPNIHRTLGLDNSTSLVEYLTGNAALEDVIQKDPESGMHMIFGRAVPHNALYLIGSERMRALIQALRETYDLVLIDTPACLAVSDSRVLATLSDLTLYGVAWAETPQDALCHGVKQFTDIGVPVATVLMNVDIKRQVRYGYAQSIYYYKDEETS